MRQESARKQRWVIDVLLFGVSALATASSLAYLRQNLAAGPTIEQVLSSVSMIGNILGALAGYCIGLAVWLVVMIRHGMSVGYPIGIGLSLLVTDVISVIWLDETIDGVKLFGTLLIAAGIFLVTRHPKKDQD